MLPEVKVTMPVAESEPVACTAAKSVSCWPDVTFMEETASDVMVGRSCTGSVMGAEVLLMFSVSPP